MKNKKLVLIIDDERFDRQLLRMHVQVLGYDYIFAENGKIGLKLVKEYIPDLILLDAVMPTMDGFEMCGLLKQDKRYKNIPVIFITERMGREVYNKFIDSKGDFFITKPIDFDMLKNIIKRIL